MSGLLRRGQATLPTANMTAKLIATNCWQACRPETINKPKPDFWYCVAIFVRRATALRKLLRLSCLLLLSWLVSTEASAQQVLKWGADPSGGAPYVYADPANPDRYIGYEKEMVDALAAAINRKPEFVPTDWESIVSTLQRGSFDIAVNGLEPTADRAQQILFSKPYYVFEQQLTVRKDEARIHSIADCLTLHLVVGTLGNTAASRYLQKEGIPFRGYPDPVAAYRDLELKRIDGVLMDVPMEMYYARSNSKIKAGGRAFSARHLQHRSAQRRRSLEGAGRCRHRQDHSRRDAGTNPAQMEFVERRAG